MYELTPLVSDTDHHRGDLEAPIILLEYGDFECPNCGEAYPILKRLQRYFGRDLCLVYRNFPLTESHPHAYTAACAAEAAALQEEFWLMHDTLFENQDNLSEEALILYARDIDLVLDQFKRDLGSVTVRKKIASDIESGLRSGVNGTPTFYINNKRYNGYYDYETMIDRLERELDRRKFSHG